VLPPDPATFDSLREEVDRLTRLASSLDVLAGAGDARDAARDVDVGGAVRTAADLVAPALARRRISMTVDAPAGLVARARPDELTQVLANLLQNAQRYTPEGGDVRVIADRVAAGVRVRVANSGPGIPPEDLPRVWERFYRVEKSRDRARGGAGIGLTIVRQLVEGAGGQVGVASEEGWTTFWVTMPG
jgi:signal transduction histidine kinase